jgi:hypothetical protein
MITSATKKLLLSTAAGILVLAGAVAPASAKGKNNHHRHHFRVAPIIVTSGHSGCDYFYWKWKQTGVRYWKAKYFSCIG